MTPSSPQHYGAPGAGPLDDRFPEDVLSGLAEPGGGAAGRGGAPSRLLAPWAWAQLRFAVDFVVLYLAIAAALLVDDRHYSRGAIILAGCFPLLALAVLRVQHGSVEKLKTTFVDIFESVVEAVSLTGMLLIAIAAIFGIAHPLQTIVRAWLYSAIYLCVARYALVLLRRHIIAAGSMATPTLIVGAGVIGSHLANRLLGDPSYGLRPVAVIDPDPLRDVNSVGASSVPVLSDVEDVAGAVRDSGAHHVILAFSSEPDHLLAPRIREFQALGVEVSLVPRMYESINERTTLDHVGGLPVLTLHTVDPRGWQFGIKHTLDRTGAAIGLLLASPLLCVLAICIRLSSPGPILFRQRRIGRDGHEFDLLKFRSMRLAPEEAAQATFVLTAGHAPGGVEGMDRRTWIGRLMRDLSLDELPQLINVLRGDMSLVGPRPERPEYVARFTQEVVGYENRHRVRSGITGWAQVHGLRGQTSIADRVEWDNYYILNWSLRLDLRILAMTIAEIFSFREST